jgi:glyoxylase I family protein
LRAELALARRDPASAGGDLLALLADDFLEVGRSGRTWTRESIAELLTGSAEPAGESPELEDFEVAPLGPSVALVTYHAAGAKRVSVWVRRDGRWLLRYHQGTPAEKEAAGG